MQICTNLLRGHIPLAVFWVRSWSPHVILASLCFPALVATTVRPPEGPEALPCLPLNRPTLGPNRESSVPATHLLLQLPNKDGAAKAPTVTGCI